MLNKELETVYYWDITDKELTNKRRKNLRFNYFSVMGIIAAYTILSISSLIALFKRDFFTMLFILYFFSLIFFSIVLYRLLIVPPKYALLRGIKLTSTNLMIGNKNYPLSSVLYSEVADLPATGGLLGYSNAIVCRWLAIILCNEKRDKKIVLIRATETSDILELSNNIRKLKGIPKQNTIGIYSGYNGYSLWRKNIMKKVININCADIEKYKNLKIEGGDV